MKLLINYFSIIFISLSVYGQECETSVFINSDAANFSIFINDSIEFVDQNIIDLEKGFYKISVKDNSSDWNAKFISEFIYLDSCQTTQLYFNFSNNVLIDSDPQDVQVFSDDSLLGYTPLILPYNNDKITLRKNGFVEKQIMIEQQMSRIKVKLDIISPMKKESFLDGSISKILFGSMIILGATSAYYKIKADDYYDKYLRTGDEKYKDKTSQYDLISGITFGLTQINFGYLIYKIFIDK